MPADHTALYGPRPSVNELAQQGKQLRKQGPRSDLGTGCNFDRDPIALLEAQNAGRVQSLVPIRWGRMSQSAFAFYRGAAALMAHDLAPTPVSGVRVQACGDAHLSNFGFYASPERELVFDLNDFDETLPAPWEWDVERLVASLVVAARSSGFGDQVATTVAIGCARAYRTAMRWLAARGALQNFHTLVKASELLSRSEQMDMGAAGKEIARATRKAEGRTSETALQKQQLRSARRRQQERVQQCELHAGIEAAAVERLVAMSDVELDRLGDNARNWYLDNDAWVQAVSSGEYRHWMDRQYGGKERK